MTEALPALLDWLWSGAPDPATEALARELLLDTLGCAIAGSAEPEVAALFRAHAAAERGALRFPGLPLALSAEGFTRCVAAASCWHEACEGLAAAHGRPGLHAVAAVLAPALLGGHTLGRVLAAIAAGYEVGGRLGAACRIRPGMHVDGTWGSFAAAAAVAHLRGSSPAVALAALEHVACHMPFSLYWPIAQGSTARNAYVGHGALHGAAAVAAAQAGLGGPAGSIDEWARVALGLPSLPALLPPGRRLIADGYLKPYPAVRHVHYGVAAAEAWHAAKDADGGDPEAIEAITLRIYAEALTYCGNRAPTTAIQAQFSLGYGLAHTLVHGTLDPAAYGAAALADPLVRRLEAMAELVPDPARTEAGRRGCTLVVRSAGRDWRREVDAVAGDPGHRMTRPAILAKFHAYAAPRLGDARAGAIAALVMDADPATPFSLDPAGPAPC